MIPFTTHPITCEADKEYCAASMGLTRGKVMRVFDKQTGEDKNWWEIDFIIDSLIDKAHNDALDEAIEIARRDSYMTLQTGMDVGESIAREIGKLKTSTK